MSAFILGLLRDRSKRQNKEEWRDLHVFLKRLKWAEFRPAWLWAFLFQAPKSINVGIILWISTDCCSQMTRATLNETNFDIQAKNSLCQNHWQVNFLTDNCHFLQSHLHISTIIMLWFVHDKCWIHAVLTSQFLWWKRNKEKKTRLNYVTLWHRKKNILLKPGSDEAVKEKEIEEKAIKQTPGA